jgi:hypothetical protein
MTQTELKNKVKDQLHKYCTGTLDDTGRCYIPSDNYDALVEDIILPLLDTLYDVLMQSCFDKEEDGQYFGFSRCLSAYAMGLKLLAKYGLFEITEEQLRHVTGKFKYEDEN